MGGQRRKFLRDNQFRPGTNSQGTVFRISPSGNFTNLYSFFPTATRGAYPTRGAGARASAIGSFYGTTEYGGTGGSGTVFKLSVPLNPPPNQVSAIQLSGTNVVITIPMIAGRDLRKMLV